MTDQQIKELLSKHVLTMENKAVEVLLRTIIFQIAENINWQLVWLMMKNYMPEMNQIEFNIRNGEAQ
jgi:hypothetical protein